MRHHAHSRLRLRLRLAVSGCTAAALLVTLAACAPGPEVPITSPTASADAPASSSPAPAETQAPADTGSVGEVRALVIRPEALELVDGSGATVSTFSYDGPTAPVLDALAALLGDPEEDPFEGGTEAYPGVEHVWEGILISDSERPVEPGAARGNDFTVIASAASVEGPNGDIDVVTGDGIAVGNTLTSVMATPGTIASGLPGEVAVEFGPSRGASETELFPNAYTVMVYGDASGSVKTVLAPANLGVARV
jgi:hypothetical protein